MSFFLQLKNVLSEKKIFHPVLDLFSTTGTNKVYSADQQVETQI